MRQISMVKHSLVFVVGFGLLAWSSLARSQTKESGSPRAGTFAPNASLTLVKLEQLVNDHSSSVEDERLGVDLAESEVKQSRLWENPELDFQWGTIPIGSTNPPGLANPYLNIPNYSVSLSYRLLLGKRGPRQNRAHALKRAAKANFDAAVRERALDLAQAVGLLATLSLRLEGLSAVHQSGKQALELTKVRVDNGFGTPLDVDRLELDNNRIEQQILSSEGEMVSALSTCSRLAGLTCKRFGTTKEARAFLDAWIHRARQRQGLIEKRADVLALKAYTEAAVQEGKFGKAQAIPDPTFRIGYVRDNFVISGNQVNSLFVGVTIPLPLFDHGQAVRAGALAKQTHLESLRRKRVHEGYAQLKLLRKRVDLEMKRGQLLTNSMLPRARSVVRDLEKAAETKLIALTDAIQARRTLSELLIEESNSLADAFESSIRLLSLLPSQRPTR
jgi:outer membrane protein, heavy metal efflux system